MINFLKETFKQLGINIINYLKTSFEIVKIILFGDIPSVKDAVSLGFMSLVYILPIILVLYFIVRIIYAHYKQRTKIIDFGKEVNELNSTNQDKVFKDHCNSITRLTNKYEEAKKLEIVDNTKYVELNKKLLSKYTSKELGKIAEDKCAKILDTISGMEIFRNEYIYKKDDTSNVVECDLIGVTKNAIFLFEVKSLYGVIEASRQDFWKLKDYTGKVIGFKYSPFLQNVTHVSMLKQILPSRTQHTFYNIVVFDDRTKLEYDNINEIINEYNDKMQSCIIKMSDLKEVISSIVKEREEISYPTGDVVAVLDKYANPTEEIKNNQLQLSKYKNETIKGF